MQPTRIFNRHLKPLSIYSRIGVSDDVDSLSPIPSWTSGDPFCNFRVELVNTSSSASCKRQLDDSRLDEAPPKKTCPATCSSPDLGCVLDPFETLKEVKNSTPKPSSSIVLNKVNKIESKTIRIHNQFDTQIKPVHTCDFNDETRNAFSFEIDEIRSLSPLNHDDVHFIQSCQTFQEKQLSLSHSSSNSSKQNQDQSVGISCKNECDEGYVTRFCSKESPQMSNDITESDIVESNNTKLSKAAALNDNMPPVSQTKSPLMSTPLTKYKELVEQFLLSKPIEEPEEKLTPILNHQPLKAHSDQATCTCLKYSPNSDALPQIPFLNKEGTPSVGTMIEKSLACQTKQHASIKENEKCTVSVSQLKMGPDYQDTSCEPSGAESSLETTIPLQVQVKSKVILLSKQQQDADSIPAVKAPEPLQRENKTLAQPESKVQYVRQVNKEVPRPSVFAREEDWEREKRVYVNSVTRHMSNNTRGGDVGVMEELLHLMNSVANRGLQSNGNQWQHPSDLTRRNYQRHNKVCQLSLDDWQNLNMCKFRRFANVPQKFKRSPVL